MKTISIAAILVAIILNQACGVIQDVNQSCRGSDIETTCNVLLGDKDYRQDVKNDEQDAKIANLIKQLGIQSANNINSMYTLSAQLHFLLLQENTDSSRITQLQTEIDALQIQANSLMAQMTVLTTDERITEFVDPCGPAPGFNEVLIRTSGNRLVAYFEQGSNRFLSSIGPGYYQTTDAQRCSFTVNSQMQVCDSLGCH